MRESYAIAAWSGIILALLTAIIAPLAAPVVGIMSALIIYMILQIIR